MGLGGTILLQQFAENGRNVVLEDQILLIDPFEQAAPQAIDGLALLVHHVVVLEQVFAGFEVLPFDRFLRGLDAAGNHLRLDRDALFHAQPLQQVRDPLLGEDAHQIVFQRKIEARRPGIALAAGASAKLVVDAARLVALRTENVQAADRRHFVVLHVGLRFVAVREPQSTCRSGPCTRFRCNRKWKSRRLPAALRSCPAPRATAARFPSSPTPAWP